MALETIINNKYIKKGEFFKEEQIIFAFGILTNEKFSDNEIKEKIHHLLYYLEGERVSNKATLEALKYIENNVTNLKKSFNLYHSNRNLSYEEFAEEFMNMILDDERLNNGKKYGIVFDREERNIEGKIKSPELNSYSSGCPGPSVSSRCGSSIDSSSGCPGPSFSSRY